MLQIYIESLFLPFALIFIVFGLYALSWLVIHVEYARHASRGRIIAALVLGSLFIGLGIHFLLLYTGS
ncbi:MAG: hypothetical protein QXQ81_07515 [Candidatus Thorarchaeota archaeon]